MSVVTSWLISGFGAGGATLIIAAQPALLVPVLITVGALVGLPLLLIATLALVAVYSRETARRNAAEKILDRLLSTLRPQEPSTPTPRRRRRTGRPKT